MVIGVGVKGERQNRHIINGMWFDQWLRDTVGDAVEIGLQLLIKPDNRILEIFSHVETGNQQGLAWHGGRVNILHSRQLVEQFFHGDGEPLFNLLGACTRHGNHDVDHGYFDLRFFLPGQQGKGKHAEQQRGTNTDEGQLGVDKGSRKATGKTWVVCMFSIHGSICRG